MFFIFVSLHQEAPVREEFKTKQIMEELLKIKDKYVELSKGYVDYEKFNHYHITHHSTAIEGSTLSYQEVIMLLENGVTPGNGKPFTYLLMAKDHLEALKYTLDLAERKEKLTVDTIQILSGMILKNTGAQYHMMGGSFDAAKGDFMTKSQELKQIKGKGLSFLF